MSTTTATPEGTGQELSAEDRFAAFFDAPPEDTVEDEAAETVEEVEIEDEVEEADEADETDAEIEAESAEDADETDETLHTVRIAGEDVQVPYSELLAGYSRTGDYKRKTQELAEQRREIAAERDKLVTEREQYAAALPTLQELIESSIGPEPNANDYDNRADYLYAKDQWNTAKQQADAVKRERDRIRQETEAERAAAMRKYVEEQGTQLLQKLPAWSDPEVRQREQSSISDYMRGEGWSDQEIAQLVDHRALVAINKARLYDQLKAQGKAKVKAKKSTTKAAEPGTRELGGRGRSYRKQKERLKETGNVHDAAALLQGLFDKK